MISSSWIRGVEGFAPVGKSRHLRNEDSVYFAGINDAGVAEAEQLLIDQVRPLSSKADGPHLIEAVGG